MRFYGSKRLSYKRLEIASSLTCRGLHHTLRRGDLSKPYYITTPIYYVNAAPHVGHLFSSVVADVIARYQRLRHPERDVIFCTGTDEHGLKVQQAAETRGISPREMCDENSRVFKQLASAASISNTRFIRTTEEEHYRAVHHLWDELCKKDLIYKGKHEGWYSVSDEAFYTEKETREEVDAATGKAVRYSVESGSVVQWMEEETYKFRLSAFRDQLINWLKSDPNAIQPPHRHAEILQHLTSQEQLDDLSVSRPRSRLNWGIPVPNDPQHTIYVWIDALTNYLTAVGYPWVNEVANQTRSWPADIQVIGKDITRFHTIYWPAMLFALGLQPPKTVLTHAHWTMDRYKMSKSRGNVANPFEVMEYYGTDPVRYYLMRNAAIADDSDWSNEQVKKHYQRDLAGILGNLPMRIRALKRLPESYVAVHGESSSGNEAAYTLRVDPDNTADIPIHQMIYGEQEGDVLTRFEDRMNKLQISKAVELTIDMVTEANAFFSNTKPWESKSTEVVVRGHFYPYLALRLAGVLLQPIMPSVSMQLLDGLGIPPQGRTWDGVRQLINGSRVEWSKSQGPSSVKPLFKKIS
ncbi:methionyl-tRNA synthetase [Tulasnella sp. 418]|nr:methionyl-tRNA synthetase [Tulasnella sp. 418]